MAEGQGGLAGRREADPTDQPRPGGERVEVRVLWHRLREPLPLSVSQVIRFLFSLAPERPGGTLADVIVGM